MGALSERLTVLCPSVFSHCAFCLRKRTLKQRFPGQSTCLRGSFRSAAAKDGNPPLCISRISPKKSGAFCKRAHLFPATRARRSRVNAVGKKGKSYFELEMEIFRFMETSPNPDAFPTRKELIDAGRWDLVNAIQLEGGWLAVGWEEEIDDETFLMSSENSSLSSVGSLSSWQDKLVSKTDASLVPEGQNLDRKGVDTGVSQSVGYNVTATGVKGVDLSSRSVSRIDSSFMSKLDALTNEHIAGLGLGFDNWGNQAFRAPQKNKPSAEKATAEFESLNGVAGKALFEEDTGLNGSPSPAVEADISAETVVQPEDAVQISEEIKLQGSSIAKESEDEMKLQGSAVVDKSAEEMKLQESSGAKESAEEMKLQESSGAKESAEEMKLQGSSIADKGVEQIKLQESSVAKESAEKMKLQGSSIVEKSAEEEKLQGSLIAKESAEAKKLLESLIAKESAEAKKLLESLIAKESAGEMKPSEFVPDAESTAADETTSSEEGGLSSSCFEAEEIEESVNLEGPMKVEEAEYGAEEIEDSLFREGPVKVEEAEGRAADAGKSPSDDAEVEVLQGETSTAESKAEDLSSKSPPEGEAPSYLRDAENEWRELRAAQKSLGLPDDVVPSKRQLISILRWDILRAGKKDGGTKQVVAGQKATEKKATSELPPPEAVTPESEPELSPLDRLLKLVGLGPKPKVKAPEASVSSPPKEVDEKTKAQDEQQVAQRLRDSLMPQFFRKKKGKRREETSVEAGDEAEEREKKAEVVSEESIEPKIRQEVADVVEDREEEEADASNGREDEIMLRVEPETSALKAEPQVRSESLLQRIRALEESLEATRDSLQNDRESLTQNREFLKGLRINTLRELSEVSDSLEFREDEMQRTAQALRRTQAEMRVFEGSIASNSLADSDALDNILADPKNLEEVLTVVELRTVRVVWPHEGNVVELTGSFNAWQERIKMERSNAGVFIATLSLPPGRYEMKFIVDGVWRVDAQRLITYEDGNENNVLNVF